MKQLDKIHPTLVNLLLPDENLGKEIIALRYDLIIPIIDGMIKESERQETGDRGRGRIKLANELNELTQNLKDTRVTVENLVKICKPYIEREKSLNEN